jgi:hypothetical protein
MNYLTGLHVIVLFYADWLGAGRQLLLLPTAETEKSANCSSTIGELLVDLISFLDSAQAEPHTVPSRKILPPVLVSNFTSF